jgi:hypothetical protein
VKNKSQWKTKVCLVNYKVERRAQKQKSKLSFVPTANDFVQGQV